MLKANKIWNIAHFNGIFVFSFNDPFLDLLSALVRNRFALNFCHTNNGIYVLVADRDDACVISDCVEQAIAGGLRDGAMFKFSERLSEQLKYISNVNKEIGNYARRVAPKKFF